MIRPASTDDATWIAALWNDVIAHTLVTFTTDQKSSDDVAEMIDARPVFVSDDCAGFATYGPFRSGPGYAHTVEHSVYVSEKARGRGLGASMMTHLETHARAAGHRVMVGGISGANPRAVAFHERIGFRTVGHLPQVGFKNGQWLDLVFVQKVLNPPDSAGGGG